MECIALSPVHQIHQNIYNKRFALARSTSHWTALKSDSFSINLSLIRNCAHFMLVMKRCIVIHSHVFRMEIGILSTWNFKERYDKARKKKQKNNNYVMLYFQYYLVRCVFIVPHLFAALTIYHHVSVNTRRNLGGK